MIATRNNYEIDYQTNDDTAFQPQKRGPKWRERREPTAIESAVVEHRKRGLNRYEILAVLRQTFTVLPSPSTIWRISKRHGLGRLTPTMREEKRRIIKEKVGELGHVDLHQLPRDMFLNPPEKPAYVACLIDSCSRLAWAEVLTSKKALQVMFKTLKMLNTLNVAYGVQFLEMLTDNGAEFAARANPDEHPFEQMLLELGIKHRYTRPYRPQTNGKAERFWRTLDDDVIDGTTFDNLEHFAKELFDYMVYYNDLRPHQAINGMTPKEFAIKINNVNTSAN